MVKNLSEYYIKFEEISKRFNTLYDTYLSNEYFNSELDKLILEILSLQKEANTIPEISEQTYMLHSIFVSFIIFVKNERQIVSMENNRTKN